nr:zinc finger protein 266-like isoform X3 [Equus asinus]
MRIESLLFFFILEWEIQLKTKDLAVQQDVFGEKRSKRIERERIHNEWEHYDCEQCGKVFSEHSCLKTHRTQNGENAHEDNQYGKSVLTLHRKTSTGEKLSRLNQLGRAMSPTPDIVYWKTSMQEKDLESSDGGKAFADHSYLQTQITTHNGEKLNEWMECRRSFIHITSFGVHVETCAGNSHYKCQSGSSTLHVAAWLKVDLQNAYIILL